MRSVWGGRFAIAVHKVRSERSEHLIGGGAGNDIAAYREQVGYIQGLDEALRLAEEVDRQMMGISNASGDT